MCDSLYLLFNARLASYSSKEKKHFFLLKEIFNHIKREIRTNKILFFINSYHKIRKSYKNNGYIETSENL